MRSTVLDGKQWLLTLLVSNGIKSLLSGAIYKDKRPANSNKEDIVINSLTMTNSYLQNGVFNINIYVPQRSVNIGGVVQLQKDYGRLKLITDAVYDVLEENQYHDQYNIGIEYHQDVEDGDLNFYNFRVSLNAYPQL